MGVSQSGKKGVQGGAGGGGGKKHAPVLFAAYVATTIDRGFEATDIRLQAAIGSGKRLAPCRGNERERVQIFAVWCIWYTTCMSFTH